MGKANGSMTSSRNLCTTFFPCRIDGSFDGTTDKINFTSHTRVPILDMCFPHGVVENYTVNFYNTTTQDSKLYTLVGTCITVSTPPEPAFHFGWQATKNCLVIGPCFSDRIITFFGSIYSTSFLFYSILFVCIGVICCG